ncbi:transposase [Athalassotoga saccharophila]|nr:transposase [Athalassotoga saccharophila]
MHFKDLIDSVSQSKYILLDSAYDSEDIYNTILEKTNAIPVIEINPRRGSVGPVEKDNLTRWIMKNLRIRYASLYKKRWEVERVNSNMKSIFIFSFEYIYYVPHRHYEQAAGFKIAIS